MSETPSGGSPDYTDYVMGVRQWVVDDEGYLTSTTREEMWRPGEEKTAECNGILPGVYMMDRESTGHDPEGEPPHEGHMCGLYAFYDRDTALSHGDRLTTNAVRGVVSAWGDVITHEHGYRAQYMSVEAIILEQEYVTAMGSRVSLRGAHEELADRYGVPLLSPPEVSAFMSLSGVVLEPDPSPLEENEAASGTIAASGLTFASGGTISSSGYLSPGKATLPAPRPVGWGAHGGPHYGADIVHVTWEPPPQKTQKSENLWQKAKRLLGGN